MDNNILKTLRKTISTIIEDHKNKLVSAIICILLISFIITTSLIFYTHGYQATVEAISVIANVVTIFGIVGIIISLYQIYEKSKTPDIRVKISTGFSYDEITRPGKPSITIEAQNFSYTPVSLSGYGFILPDGKIISFYTTSEIYVQLPYLLKPGKSCIVYYNIDQFIKTLKENGYTKQTEVVGFFSDELDHKYKTKPFPMRIE